MGLPKHFGWIVLTVIVALSGLAYASKNSQEAEAERLLGKWGIGHCLEVERFSGGSPFDLPERWTVSGTLKPGISFAELCRRMRRPVGAKVESTPDSLRFGGGDWAIFINRDGDSITASLTEPLP